VQGCQVRRLYESDLFLCPDNWTFSSVVWVPDPNLLKLGHHVDERPDQILASLEDFVPEEWGLPPYEI
jgi:hypothetical protein